MIKLLFTALFGVCLMLLTVPIQAAPDGDMAPNDKQLAGLYWQGQESLRKSDWSMALERFRNLESALRKKEPASADAAIYWQAYALMQSKRSTEARSTLERLRHDYPDSRWNREADSLMHQIQGTSKTEAADAGDHEDLAEIAVSGLMQAPPERAIPILRKVLQGSHSIEVKKRALFVLSQFDEDAALAMLGDIASGSSNAELRSEAIRMLGVSGEDKAVERLSAIYAASPSREVKSSIIKAWLVADRADLVLQSARSESDEELRKDAIQTLGSMEATKELRALFGSEKSLQLRKTILQSLGVAGDAHSLAEIATSNEAEELRVEAIKAIGLAEGDDSDEILVRIYTTANSPKVREAALQGMLISDDSASILKLYKEARTREEKQALLRVLTTIDGDATLELIEAELDKGSRQP